MRLKCLNEECDGDRARVVAPTYVLVRFEGDGEGESVQVLDANMDGITENIIKNGTNPETTPLRCAKCGSPMILIIDEEEYVDRVESEQETARMMTMEGY